LAADRRHNERQMFVESIAAAVSDVAQQLHLSQVVFTRPVLFFTRPRLLTFAIDSYFSAYFAARGY